jgi:phosphotriesterase-related protein
MTVLGAVKGEDLGHILPHEHILIELPEMAIRPMYRELLEEKVSLSMLGKLRRQVWTCRDNCCLNDKLVAAEEVLSFRQNGGGTIVDVTSMGLGRDVVSIQAISKKTGINIVAGTGYYVVGGHPVMIGKETIDHLRDHMVREITVGIEDTGIRAGIIGEIGVSDPIRPREKEVLTAAARAQVDTGAPLCVHQLGGGVIEDIDRILREEGVHPESVALCHMASASPDVQRRAADKGYCISFDSFGHEFYDDAAAGRIVRDPDRIMMVKSLIEGGFLRQLLVSNGISLKMLLKKYGGWGYEHIIRNIKPFMLRMGIAVKSIDTMLYYNPMRMISYLG